MNAEELRARQAPLKNRYREDPASARQTLKVRGTLDVANLACRIETGRPGVPVGLHSAAGGDGSWACSGDMLLEALVGCAGVTLLAVATALGITVRSGSVIAEGDLDFRGTLGVSKEAPVGFGAIRLQFDLDTDASTEQRIKLLQLTERYCVIAQTLRQSLLTVS
jgi:uncharacterized OsmC-like protein